MIEVLVLVFIKNGQKMSMSVLQSKGFKDQIKPGLKTATNTLSNLAYTLLQPRYFLGNYLEAIVHHEYQ